MAHETVIRTEFHGFAVIRQSSTPFLNKSWDGFTCDPANMFATEDEKMAEQAMIFCQKRGDVAFVTAIRLERAVHYTYHNNQVRAVPIPC